jgi:hypothetical protein
VLDRTRGKFSRVLWPELAATQHSQPEKCPPPEPWSRPSDRCKTVSELEGTGVSEAAVQTGKISGNRTHNSGAPQCTKKCFNRPVASRWLAAGRLCSRWSCVQALDMRTGV